MLIGNANRSKGLAERQYDCAIVGTELNVGKRVLLWGRELSTRDGNKIVKAWMAAYINLDKLGRVAYDLKSKLRNRVAKVHKNCLKRTGNTVVETGDPMNGVHPDGLIVLQKVSEVWEENCGNG